MRRGRVFGLLLAALVACGMSKLPKPSYVGHPTSALVEVPYPPPPARVEFVPDAPKSDTAVWLDGEWTWRGRRWGWKAGRWVEPPKDAKYSPWTQVRDPRGTLYVAEGVWRDAKGNPLDDPKPLVTARSQAGGLVTPEGETIPAGPTDRQRDRQPSRERERKEAADGGEVDAGTIESSDAGEAPTGDAG